VFGYRTISVFEIVYGYFVRTTKWGRSMQKSQKICSGILQMCSQTQWHFHMNYRTLHNYSILIIVSK